VILEISTPLAVAARCPDARYVRAIDDSGSFGIQPGHAELVTALEVSVLSWTDGDGVQHHAAVRGGVLRVIGGQRVAVATAEAVVADDLETLEGEILARMRRTTTRERTARRTQALLEAGALRLLYDYFDPNSVGRLG